MTKPQKLIQDILTAAANDKLEDAEKAIEDYVCDFEKWRIKKNWLLADEAGQPVVFTKYETPEKKYQQYVNQ
jgi:hypothetical protein